MRKVPFFSLIFLLLLLAGCNQQNAGTANETIRPAKMSTAQNEQNINQDDAEKAKNILLEKDYVSLVRAVQSKDLLVVGVELKHWHTFQSKKLTKEMKKKLEKELKIKNVEVTTDHKIFIELEKLEEKLISNDHDMTKKKLDKELKKINKLMKEQT